jgi:hypothetical protein
MGRSMSRAMPAASGCSSAVVSFLPDDYSLRLLAEQHGHAARDGFLHRCEYVIHGPICAAASSRPSHPNEKGVGEPAQLATQLPARPRASGRACACQPTQPCPRPTHVRCLAADGY